MEPKQTMGSLRQVECWFVIDGVQYGPATLELSEEAIFSGRMKSFRMEGSFHLNEKANGLPLNADEAEIILPDGKRGSVLFRNLQNGIKGDFVIAGNSGNLLE